MFFILKNEQYHIIGDMKMMRKLFVVISLFLFAYLVLPSEIYAQSYRYEGTQVCGTCHKTEKQGQQLKIWSESKHAGAYKTLMTEAADKIAKDKGLTTKAVESPECLSCHASGYNVADPKLVGAKFKIEDGVQCETCHGPGSAYKSLKIMKVREESVKNGLVVWKDKTEMENGCKGCHNEKSPTFKEFKFEEMWAKIAHPVPKG